MYKAVLFDLDGTLLDTSIGVKKSVLYTIETMGLPQITEEEISSFIGPPIYNSLRERFSLNEEEARRGTEIFRNAYKENFLFEASVYSGVFEFLEFLKENNIKIGVATYKREDYAISILEHFGISKFCDVIVGSDFENKMSKTDIVEKCFKMLNVEKNEAVLVGDTMHDAIGAQNFGIDFVAVTYGFGFKKGEKIEIERCIGRVNNIMNIIESCFYEVI